jgi:hypothetical protein
MQGRPEGLHPPYELWLKFKADLTGRANNTMNIADANASIDAEHNVVYNKAVSGI